MFQRPSASLAGQLPAVRGPSTLARYHWPDPGSEIWTWGLGVGLSTGLQNPHLAADCPVGHRTSPEVRFILTVTSTIGIVAIQFAASLECGFFTKVTCLVKKISERSHPAGNPTFN